MDIGRELEEIAIPAPDDVPVPAEVPSEDVGASSRH